MKNFRCSLAEAVITVASLAVFGILIMRLFILSDQINKKADTLEHAMLISSGLIDCFREHAEVTDFLSDTRLIPYTLDYAPDASVMIHKYYDAQWRPVSETDAPYCVTLTLQPEFEGFIYDVSAETLRDGAEQIAAFHTKIYTGS